MKHIQYFIFLGWAKNVDFSFIARQGALNDIISTQKEEGVVDFNGLIQKEVYGIFTYKLNRIFLHNHCPWCD